MDFKLHLKVLKNTLIWILTAIIGICVFALFPKTVCAIVVFSLIYCLMLVDEIHRG